jgi:integrase
VGRREYDRLTAIGVKRETTPGYHADGRGLYLQVSASGSKSWIHRYSLNKKPREMGLGSYPDVTLAQARDSATANRLLLKDGIDPLVARQARQATLQPQLTFEQCANEYQEAHRGSWRNDKHASQWTNTLATYAYPFFGSKGISDVNKADILAALLPIWAEKQATASRVKQRIRAVLDWSAAKDYRHGHNPGIWDEIARALPKVRDTSKHFESCPYREIHAAIETFKASGCDDTVKLALEFIILTAARTGEVRLAQWSEIDFDTARRIIPGERMKSGKEHRVPLSPRVMEILRLQQNNGSNLIFPNPKGKPYSDMTFTTALRRLKMDFTVHGFRSTFRDWAAEQTSHPHAVCEAALAHTGTDKTVTAYFRSDLFDKRRELMNDWANYCATKP